MSDAQATHDKAQATIVKLDGLIRYIESLSDERYAEFHFIEYHGHPIEKRRDALAHLKELRENGAIWI